MDTFCVLTIVTDTTTSQSTELSSWIIIIIIIIVHNLALVLKEINPLALELDI